MCDYVETLSVIIKVQLSELHLKTTRSSGYLMTASRNLKIREDISTAVEEYCTLESHT